MAKVVDDLMATGETDHLKQFKTRFEANFKLGTVIYGPGHIRFYGLNINQGCNFSSTIDVEDKLKALETHVLTCHRRREQDEPLNEI